MFRIAFIAMLMLSGHLQAQNFRAKVLDLVTKEPILGATVMGSSSTHTDAKGNFSLLNAEVGDTIRIIHLGYKPYIFTFNALHPGLVYGTPPEITLEPISIVLSEVFVRSHVNTKADSLKNRMEFASEFNYKRSSFKDIFVVKSPEESMARHVDVHRGNNTYSASSLIKLDVLSVVGYIAGKKTRPSRLQKTLLQDEGNKYVDQAFSKDRIVELTKLTGDSLKNFMIQYRPTLAKARDMTDYEMMGYIRRMYLEFTK